MSGGELEPGHTELPGQGAQDPDAGDKVPAINSVIEYQKWTVIKAAVIGFFVVAGIGALYPITVVLAGKTTNVDVNFALSLTFTLAISQTGTFLWGRQRSKAAKDARDRIAKLEAELSKAKATNEVLQERAEGLADDLNALRGDRDGKHRGKR